VYEKHWVGACSANLGSDGVDRVEVDNVEYCGAGMTCGACSAEVQPWASERHDG